MYSHKRHRDAGGACVVYIAIYGMVALTLFGVVASGVARVPGGVPGGVLVSLEEAGDSGEREAGLLEYRAINILQNKHKS